MEHPNQFHFNTYKLNKYLQNFCVSRNIKFIEDTIKEVNIKGDQIKYVKGKQKHTFDFYIDSINKDNLIDLDNTFLL